MTDDPRHRTYLAWLKFILEQGEDAFLVHLATCTDSDLATIMSDSTLDPETRAAVHREHQCRIKARRPDLPGPSA